MHRFFKLLTARRLLRGTEHEQERMSLNRLIQAATKAWHGARLNQPDWSDHSRSVAFTAEIRKEKLLFHLILNAYWEPLDFELPPAGKGRGSRCGGGLIRPSRRRMTSSPGKKPPRSPD